MEFYYSKNFTRRAANRAVFIWVSIMATLACSTEREVAAVRKSAVYGEDNRTEVFLESDKLWRDRAKKSVAGLLYRRRYELCADATAASDRKMTTLEEGDDLCPGETFGDQYQEAYCTATLVDRDLVMTAAHCVVDGCRGLIFGFGMYYESAGVHRTMTPDDFYGCRRLVKKSAVRDVAILQLDRPVVAPYEPASIAMVAPKAGDAVGTIGFPSAVPMKIARSCQNHPRTISHAYTQ